MSRLDDTLPGRIRAGTVGGEARGRILGQSGAPKDAEIPPRGLLAGGRGVAFVTIACSSNQMRRLRALFEASHGATNG